MINVINTGKYIQTRRKKQGLSQREVAEKLNVSFQAVSKWENGENLPEAGLLLELADLLDTTTDKILCGGNIMMRTRKTVSVYDIKEGFEAFDKFCTLIGEKSTFCQGAIEGINSKMNIDFDSYRQNEYYREIMIAEALIQYLMNGYTVDEEETDRFFKTEKCKQIIRRYMK